MPEKITRSAPRPSFGFPEPLVAIHTLRQSCCKAAKARIFTPVRESSGESQRKSPLLAWESGEFRLSQDSTQELSSASSSRR